MFAIIKTGGKQFKVQNGDVIFVEKLNAAEGETVKFDVLMLASDDEVKYRYAKGEGRLIHYGVSVRLDGVMAGGRFLGISDSENTVTYVIDSSTASEKI